MCEGELAGDQRGRTRGHSDCGPTDWTCARMIGEESSSDGGEERQGVYSEVKCGVSKNVAHARQAFLWTTEARSLRHIFARG